MCVLAFSVTDISLLRNDDLSSCLPSQPRQLLYSLSQTLISFLQRPDLALLLLHCPADVRQSLYRRARFLDFELDGNYGGGEVFGRERVDRLRSSWISCGTGREVQSRDEGVDVGKDVECLWGWEGWDFGR
jgi:hypothetical protein